MDYEEDDEANLSLAKAHLFASETVYGRWAEVTGLLPMPALQATAAAEVERRLAARIDPATNTSTLPRLAEIVFRDWWRERPNRGER